MKKGILDLFLIPALVLLSLGVGLMGLGQIPVQEHVQTQDPFLTQLAYDSHVCVTLKPVNGEDQFLGCQSNTVTDTGFNMLMDYLDGGIGAVGFNWTVLGNTTAPSTGSTSHPGEIAVCGLSGTTIDSTRRDSTGNRTISTTWTFTGCGNGLLIANSTGLYNASAGTYFAGVAFTDASFATDGDQLEVNWTQEFSES